MEISKLRCEVWGLPSCAPKKQDKLGGWMRRRGLESPRNSALFYFNQHKITRETFLFHGPLVAPFLTQLHILSRWLFAAQSRSSRFGPRGRKPRE